MAALGFGLTLGGAYVIFLVQRWYARADRIAEDDKEEQARLTLELERQVIAFKESAAFRFPTVLAVIIYPLILDDRIRLFVAQLDNYRVRLKDPELKEFCSLYANCLVEFAKPFMRPPFILNGFFGSAKISSLAGDASHALSHYLSDGSSPSPEVFHRLTTLKARDLWKGKKAPEPTSRLPTARLIPRRLCTALSRYPTTGPDSEQVHSRSRRGDPGDAEPQRGEGRGQRCGRGGGSFGRRGARTRVKLQS